MTLAKKEKLFVDNMPLVKFISSRYKCPEDLRDDMLQEGYIALWKAVDSDAYDPSKGRFSTFAGTGIQRVFYSYSAKTFNTSGLSASVDILTKKVGKLAKELESIGSDITYDEISEAIGDNVDKPTIDAYRRLLFTASSTDVAYGYKDDASIVDNYVSATDEYDLDDDDILQIVRDAVNSLPPKEQDAVWLVFGFDGEPLSFREAGEILGVSNTTVGNYIRKAKEHLSEMLSASIFLYLS